MGAWGDDDGGNDSGAVYVFEPDAMGAWVQIAKLTASDAGPDDQLGYSVSASGDTVLVGAWGDDDGGSDAGAAYVFGPDAMGDLVQVVKLTASDAGLDDRFGRAVALSGDRALIGADGDDDEGSNAGAAYTFARDAMGAWGSQSKLLSLIHI